MASPHGSEGAYRTDRGCLTPLADTNELGAGRVLMDVDSSELQATDVAAQPGHVF